MKTCLLKILMLLALCGLCQAEPNELLTTCESLLPKVSSEQHETYAAMILKRYCWDGDMESAKRLLGQMPNPDQHKGWIGLGQIASGNPRDGFAVFEGTPSESDQRFLLELTSIQTDEATATAVAKWISEPGRGNADTLIKALIRARYRSQKEATEVLFSRLKNMAKSGQLSSKTLVAAWRQAVAANRSEAAGRFAGHCNSKPRNHLKFGLLLWHLNMPGKPRRHSRSGKTTLAQKTGLASMYLWRRSIARSWRSVLLFDFF